MSVKYSFSKAVNAAKLDVEIRASAIITAIDYITSTPTTVDIYFKSTLSAGDEALLSTIVTDHVNTPLALSAEPQDSDGSRIIRPKATKTGWHFQFHGIEVELGKVAATKCFKINPTTFVKEDLGFASSKIYESDGNGGYVETNTEANAVVTVIEWLVNHDMELRDGQLSQAGPPTGDVYFQAYNIVGPYAVPFTTGAVNLKHFGVGAIIDANGQAAKPISAGMGKFRLIFHHSAGEAHKINVVFKLYKAVA